MEKCAYCGKGEAIHYECDICAKEGMCEECFEKDVEPTKVIFDPPGREFRLIDKVCKDCFNRIRNRKKN